MSDAPNPFEAPGTAEPEYQFERFTGEPGELELGQAYKDGWNALWSNFGLWLGIGVVGYVVAVASMLTVIGFFLVVPILMWGWVKFILNTVDGDASFGDLFSGFNNFGSNLGRVWLAFLIFIGGSIPLAIALGVVQRLLVEAGVGPIGNMIFSFVLNIVIACLVMPRLFCWPFFLVDHDMGAVESLKASWAATQGQVLRLLALFASFYGLMLVAYIPMFIWIGKMMQGGLLGGSVNPFEAVQSMWAITLFFGAVVFLAALVFYGACASAYRQIAGTEGPVPSSL